jgi:hypothetical protein
MGMKFYVYHHITAISTPVNWCGPKVKRCYNSNIGQNEFGVETVQVKGIIGGGLFSLFTGYKQSKDLQYHLQLLLLIFWNFLWSVEAMVQMCMLHLQVTPTVWQISYDMQGS